MSEVGDTNKKMVGKASLVNSNKKGSEVTETEVSSNLLGKDFDFDDETIDKKCSEKSEFDSLKMKEVDRFGFVGGSQYTDPFVDSSFVQLEVLRMRELKWIEMLENWDKWMSKKFKKVKKRCRKGIPDSLRARSWQMLTGSATSLAEHPDLYQSYIGCQGNPTCLEEIKRDVSRQYPHHELFIQDQGQGQEDLYSVLMAYSIHNPTVGYCQAQGPLAAVLLTLMPAEQAFWCFLTICEKYLPGYYNTGLEAVQIDSMALFGLLKKACPIAYKHLKKQKVEPILWMTDWFMCLYSRTLPWPSVLRVWDMFLCEGIKVIFQVALVLVKSVLGTSEQVNKCPTFYDTLDRLRKLPPEYMEENYLIKEMAKLQITEKDMEKEHEIQLKKWNINKEQKQKNNSSQLWTTTPILPSTTSAVSISTSTLAATTTNASCSKLTASTSTTPMQPQSSPDQLLPAAGSLPLPSEPLLNSSLKPFSSPLKIQPSSSISPPLPPAGEVMGKESSVTSSPPISVLTNDYPQPSISKQKDTSSSQSKKQDLLPTAETQSEGASTSLISTLKSVSGLAEDPSNQQPEKKQKTRVKAETKKSANGRKSLNQEQQKLPKPSLSPSSSLSTIPSLTEKKKMTFRLSWHKSKGSKSTTHITK